MKRFIFCMGMASVLGLSGCAPGVLTAKPDIDKCFSAETEIKVDNESLTGTLCRLSEGCWELNVTSPYALEGLTVMVDENGTRYSMLGLEAAGDVSDSAMSAVRLIMEAYEYGADNMSGFSENTLECTNENGGFTIVFDGEGKPSELNIPEKGIIVTFSEWEEITPQAAETSEEDDMVIVE